jgi:diacylglycerol O-acyltransferase / wax synthase
MTLASSLHMSSADAAWLRMDGPANPMVINSLIRFEGPLDVGRLSQVLQRRLVAAHPKFAMLVHAGRLPLVGSLPSVGPLPAVGPRWERDPRFALGRHLHRRALPRPRDEAALRALVGDLVSSPLPDDRPPWQAYLIECADSEDTALLVRMHHCIADGIALAQVLLSLTDGLGEDERSGAPQVAARSEDRSPHGVAAGAVRATSALLHESLERLLHPRRLLALARGGARDVEVLAKLLAHPADPAGALKRPLTGMRRVGWSRPIALEEVKAIAHHSGATVNDVLLAAVTGGIRGHLRDGGVAAPRRMTAIVPVNLRPPGAPLPPELGNRFGLVFLDLPLSERAPSRRLTIVKERMDAIKRSPEAPVSYAVLQGMGLAPAEVESRAVALFSAKGTAVVTNVPGPREPRLLAGTTVRDLAIWAPASGSVGMSVSLFSYRGKVTVGLLADTAVLSDPHAVAERVASEIDALAPARGVRGHETPGGRQVA